MFQPTLPYLVSAKEKGVSEDVCVTRGGFKNVGIQVKQRLQPLVSLPMYLNGVDVEARARRGGDEERGTRLSTNPFSAAQAALTGSAGRGGAGRINYMYISPAHRTPGRPAPARPRARAAESRNTKLPGSRVRFTASRRDRRRATQARHTARV